MNAHLPEFAELCRTTRKFKLTEIGNIPIPGARRGAPQGPGGGAGGGGGAADSRRREAAVARGTGKEPGGAPRPPPGDGGPVRSGGRHAEAEKRAPRERCDDGNNFADSSSKSMN